MQILKPLSRIREREDKCSHTIKYESLAISVVQADCHEVSDKKHSASHVAHAVEEVRWSIQKIQVSLIEVVHHFRISIFLIGKAFSDFSVLSKVSR